MALKFSDVARILRRAAFKNFLISAGGVLAHVVILSVAVPVKPGLAAVSVAINCAFVVFHLVRACRFFREYLELRRWNG
jgi:hypothetical protein